MSTCPGATTGAVSPGLRTGTVRARLTPDSIVEVGFRSNARGFNGNRPDLSAYVPALPGNQAISLAPFGKKHLALAFNLERKPQALAGLFHPATGEHAGNLQGYTAIGCQTSRS